MTNKLILNILFFIQSFLLITCSEIEDNKSKLFHAKQELKILLNDPVETLDPLKILYDSDWRVASNIYEGLFTLNEKHDLLKGVVDSFSLSEDNLIYTFWLKDNVYFHDCPCFPDSKGRKLNSSDISYTFQRLATKSNSFNNWEIINNRIEGISDYYDGNTNNISGILLIDSLSLRIKLTKPFSSFLNLLTSPGFYVVPFEAVDYFEERFSKNPVGTGPFRISEYDGYDEVTLVRNENYYKKDRDEFRLPYLQTITYTTIDKSENRFTELVKNNTDFINASALEFNKFCKDSVLLSGFMSKSINLGDGIRFWGFNFNNQNREAYQELRRGIVFGLNREYINKSEFHNIKAESLLPSHYLQEEIKWYEFNKGYECNTEFIKKYIDTVKIMANLEYDDLSEIEKVLDRLKLPYSRIIKRANYYSEISKIKPTMFRVSMVPAFPDPIEYYGLFYSKNAGGINLGNFKNKDFDEIYEYLMIENNDKLRKDAYMMLEEILKKEIAAIYLTHQGPVNYIFSNRLRNINFKYLLPDFTTAYFE